MNTGQSERERERERDCKDEIRIVKAQQTVERQAYSKRTKEDHSREDKKSTNC